MENNNLIEREENLVLSEDKEEEYTPKLFSEDQNHQSEEVYTETDHKENIDQEEQLFDQDINEEEDFEIPAFLRKQKF